jgi:hypothetical protein
MNVDRMSIYTQMMKIMQNRSTKLGRVNISFENATKLIGLRTTLMNKNHMLEILKSILKSGKTCYYSVQSFIFPFSV